MENSKTEKPKDLQQKSNQKCRENQVQISHDLFKKIQSFVALSNNHLMTIPVEGNQILNSAKVMNMALEIHEELEELENEN